MGLVGIMEPQCTSVLDPATFEMYRQETRPVQFMMALRPKFEHASNRSLLPSVEVALSKLLPEEQIRSSCLRKDPSD